MIKIGIIGGGFVGQATYLLNCKDIECKIYDIDTTKCIPSDVKLKDFQDCNIIFICVPTPMRTDRSCHTGIVESVIKQIREELPTQNNIVVRSTVPVGFCEKNKVHFMPEFLTESNWREDFYECNNWIVGINEEVSGHQELIDLFFKNLFITAQKNNVVYNTHVTIMSPSEAEMVKYVRNTFLATKVSFFNEIYNFCGASNVSYETIIRQVCNDKRIGGSHSRVPGPDGKRGFGGTCLPKDANSLQQQFIEKNVDCPILAAVVRRNEEIDRPELDWMEDKGRAFIE